VDGRNKSGHDEVDGPCSKGIECHNVVVMKRHKEGAAHMKISTIGLDTSKRLFQVHGVDASDEVVLRKQFRRAQILKFFAELPPCLVGIEACAASHYWAREIGALGHEVRLVPPIRVKAYVKRGAKNDAADAAAICEAVTRRCIRFVPIKTVEQQQALILHRARQLLIDQRTRLGNSIRAHLAEFGIIAAKGEAGFTALLQVLTDAEDTRLPPIARGALALLADQFEVADQQIGKLDRQILAWHQGNEDSRRLATVPQFGPIIASALVAKVGDASRFKRARQLPAWIGLVPSQHSTAGVQRLGHITKAGDRYLRKLLVLAAMGMIRRARAGRDVPPWFKELLGKKEPKLAAIALANKLARIAWVILVRKETYKTPRELEAAIVAA
jgi:transposase